MYFLNDYINEILIYLHFIANNSIDLLILIWTARAKKLINPKAFLFSYLSTRLVSNDHYRPFLCNLGFPCESRCSRVPKTQLYYVKY